MSSESVFRALAHPSRRKMVELLARREWAATELAGQFRHAQPTLSRHLGILRAAGIVRGKRQGASLMYELAPGGMAELRRWLDKLPQQAQR